ncbi:MAG: tetratricopeptide repeat protein, partial [Myxococcota bacterium]
ITAYQRALELDSNLHDVRYNLAYALRSMGDHKAAIDAYQTYLKGAPKDPDALFGLAESLKGDAQWSAAADAFERYADAEDRPTQTRWATYARKEAADLRAKNRTNEVTTEAALAEVPTVDDTPSVATVTDIDDEDAPAIGALSDEDRAQIVPEAPPSDDQQAAPTRAQRRPPTFREGLKHLRAGDFARALRPLARAAEASPNDPIVLSALGSAHLGVSNAKAALITYRRALALEPDAAMVSALHFGIGEAQRMAGDDASARVALMQVVSADATPDHLKKLARARLDALR